MPKAKSRKPQLRLNKYIQVDIKSSSEVAYNTSDDLNEDNIGDSNYDLYEISPVTLRLENVLNISNVSEYSTVDQSSNSLTSNITSASSEKKSVSKLWFSRNNEGNKKKSRKKGKLKTISDKFKKGLKKQTSKNLKDGCNLEKKLVLSMSILPTSETSKLTQTRKENVELHSTHNKNLIYVSEKTENVELHSTHNKNLIYVSEEKEKTMKIFERHMDRWSVLDEEFIEDEGKAEDEGLLGDEGLVQEEKDGYFVYKSRAYRSLYYGDDGINPDVDVHGYLISTPIRKVHSDDSVLFVKPKIFFSRPQSVYNGDYEEEDVKPALIRISSHSVYGDWERPLSAEERSVNEELNDEDIESELNLDDEETEVAGVPQKLYAGLETDQPKAGPIETKAEPKPEEKPVLPVRKQIKKTEQEVDPECQVTRDITLNRNLSLITDIDKPITMLGPTTGVYKKTD